MDTNFVTDYPVSTAHLDEASPRILRLRINGGLSESLREMAILAQATPAGVACELIEAGIAEFRLKKISQDFLIPRGPARVQTQNSNNNHRRPPSEQYIEQILALRNSEHMSISAIAERFKTSKTRIARILRDEGE